MEGVDFVDILWGGGGGGWWEGGFISIVKCSWGSLKFFHVKVQNGFIFWGYAKISSFKYSFG